MANDVNNPNPRIRPRQVLLIGLGGIGSRTVDKVLSIMPEGYKKYTRAIAVDTDIGELHGELKHIPVDNRIALGSDLNTKQSVTIGDYIKNNPTTTDWFVKGGKLDVIKGRNTTQGAKQVRMVSRIALAATNDFCGMKTTLEKVIRQFNADDGAVGGNGMLVMIVCSVAGGTGAGTVLQFPLYLEQALSGLFADEDVQIDCSMLLPDMFRDVQSDENYFAAKANAYAVIRELASLNSRKLRRGDIIANADLEVKEEESAPFGRVLFFDSTSMAGDTLNGDLDHVYVPKVATALNEYLFGPVNGKITSALDNTLRRVYESDNQAIFGSVGTSRLCFPRATYTQYVTAQWVSKAIAKQWLQIDQQAMSLYKEEFKKAVDNDTERPDKEKRLRELFCMIVDEEAEKNRFYKEIKSKFKVTAPAGVKRTVNSKKIDNLVQLFWNNCTEHLKAKKESDEEYKKGKRAFENNFNGKGIELARSIELLQNYEKTAKKLIMSGPIYAKQVFCPSEAEDGTLYEARVDESTLFGFIKAKKLHPIMIRYFLYKLYELLVKEAGHSGQAVYYDEIKKYKKVNKECRELINKEAGAIETNILSDVNASFAETALKDLEIYMEEYEDMFKQLNVVIDHFEDKIENCENQLPLLNQESGTVLAGGKLSMMYAWRKIDEEISAGEDAFTIDDDLNGKIHEIVYRAFVKQVVDLANVKVKLPGDKKLKVRTRYESIVERELQRYYAKKINTNYTHCFPKNVIEAALLQCGLENAYKKEAQGIDSTVGFNYSMFIERNPVPYNIKKEEVGYVTDAEYFSNLLNALIGKGKPFCGRVEGLGDSLPIINRLLALDRSMLRTKEDSLHFDEDGVPETVYIEDEIIEGVSSSSIGNFSVNTKFIDGGISVDEIASVTTVTGLEPKSFVSFLPPDNNEHSPTKEQSYFAAYNDFVDKMTQNPSVITPHLHWRWHMAGMLEDLTSGYTNTYSQQAAEAFMYGFIFDIIRFGDDGIVTIGKLGQNIFKKALGGETEKEYLFLKPEIHASFDNMGRREKRNTMDELFAKVIELLSTSTDLRSAIIAYSEEKMKLFELNSSPDFIVKCLESENLNKEAYYNDILDIVIAYHRATRHLSEDEVLKADKVVELMYKFLLKKFYDVAKYVAYKDNSDVKGIYEAYVKMLYKVAADDDPVKTEDTVKADINDMIDNMPEGGIDKISDWVNNISGTIAKKPRNPFEPDGRYGLDAALEMVIVFMNEEQ